MSKAPPLRRDISRPRSTTVTMSASTCDRPLVRVGVHLGELALRLVGAHQLVGAAHLGDDRVHGALRERRLLAPQLHGDARAHDRFLALEPLGAGRAAASSSSTGSSSVHSAVVNRDSPGASCGGSLHQRRHGRAAPVLLVQAREEGAHGRLGFGSGAIRRCSTSNARDVADRALPVDERGHVGQHAQLELAALDLRQQRHGPVGRIRARPARRRAAAGAATSPRLRATKVTTDSMRPWRLAGEHR